MLAAVFAAVVMGSLGFFVKESGLASNTMAFFRFLIGAVVMGIPIIAASVSKRRALHFSPSSFFSGFAIGCCILFYFKAVTLISIGIACFLMYIGPAFAIVGEAILLHKIPSTRDRFILLASLVGVLLLSQIGFSADKNSLPIGGVIVALLSAVSYGAYILLNRRIPYEVELGERTFWQFVAGLGVIIISFLFESPDWGHVGGAWLYILIVGLVHGVLVLLLVAYAIKHLSAMQYGTLAYLEPIVATVLGFLCYQDTLSIPQAIGIVLILGAALFQCLPKKETTK